MPQIAALLLFLLMPPAKPVKLFIVAGQSNATGRALVTETIPGKDPADAVIRYRRNTDAKYRSFGPEIAIGRALNAAYPGEVLIVKYTRGATNLEKDWDPDATSGKMLYAGMLQFVRAAQLEFDAEVAGVFWMQGESDSKWSGEYEENLRALIEAFRRDLGDLRIPFVLGRVSPNGTPERETVRAAQVNVTGSLTLPRWVDLDGWVDLDDLARFDGVHYDPPGTMLLGQRLAAEYLRLKKAGRIRRGYSKERIAR